MVVGFITTYAISAYHHWHCEFEFHSGEVNSIQHYVIKFVSDLRQVCGFSLGTPVSSTNKTGCHDINEILLKVTLNTKILTLTLHTKYFKLTSLHYQANLLFIGTTKCLKNEWDFSLVSLTENPKIFNTIESQCVQFTEHLYQILI